MKLVRLHDDRGGSFAALEGETITPVVWTEGRARPTGRSVAAATARLDTVVRPSKVICCGLNYADHAAEAGVDVPQSPILFAKHPSALIGDSDTVRIPPGVRNVDYEAELAVVIAKPCKNVVATRALDHVLGYTCLNDISARDIQLEDGQWTRAKSFDTFCPVGPWITTIDEVDDPQDLAVRCHVDGERRQDGHTKDMIFGVAELVAFASKETTLLPGDVISTGTPAGVAHPGPDGYLDTAGEVVVDIEGVGRLRNPVTSTAAAA